MIRHVEPVMGTVFSIVADDGTGIPAAVARLHHLDEVFSTYREDSVVSRMARGETVGYDAEVAGVFDRCAEVAAETGNWFTVYPEGRLDPSGWVKGWAVEEVARILTEAGSVDHCVVGGGDVQTAGRTEEGRPWRVGVADPRRPLRLAAVVEGSGIAVATSGVAERGAHIFDPSTGKPAEGFLSVTLVGSRIARTDAWATAVFAMGPALGLEWAERQAGIEAFAVLPDGTTCQTSGMARFFAAA